MEKREHELHQRRKGRNIMVGLLLGGFVLVVFAVTIVKMTRGDNMEAFDHVVRPGLEPQT
jgi:Coiled-coil domain-containing protein 56